MLKHEDLINYMVAARTTASDETALAAISLYPHWKENQNVSVDERYQYEGVLYRVIQNHTTQADWSPDTTPALFVVVSLEEWPEWIQPTGEHDAYNAGEKVLHNGIKYISEVDGNVWEPGADSSETLWSIANV